MLLITVFIFLLLLTSLMVTTYLHSNSKINIILKSLTSLSFVLIGALGYILFTPFTHSSNFLLIGLIFCALGDIALAFSHSKPLKYNLPALCGIIFFSLAHLSFITCFITLGFTIPTIYLLGPILLACLFLVMLLKDPLDFGITRFLLPIYTFIITTMLLLAIFTSNTLIMIGASLFVISDIILCFDYFFGDNHSILRPLNYLFYYIGQLLLALVMFSL